MTRSGWPLHPDPKGNQDLPYTSSFHHSNGLSWLHFGHKEFTRGANPVLLWNENAASPLLACAELGSDSPVL
jgi:hypothetical protein